LECLTGRTSVSRYDLWLSVRAAGAIGNLETALKVLRLWRLRP
jgi:hypothetical protein